MNLLYRADGGSPIGTGHLLRAARLIRELSSQSSFRARLLFSEDPIGRRLAETTGAELVSLPPRSNSSALKPALVAAPVIREIEREMPDVVVIDMLDTSEPEMQAIRATGVPLLTFDDRGEGRKHANAIANCLVTEPSRKQLPPCVGLFEGPDFAVLDHVYAEARGTAHPRLGSESLRVLVSLGGVDFDGLCVKAARALNRIAGVAQVVFACGHDYLHRAALELACEGANWSADIRLGAPTLLPLYRQADLAVVAGGLTMHEVCCAGLPAVALCQQIDHQTELAIRLTRAGAMVTAGCGAEITDERLVYVLGSVVRDRLLRSRLAKRGPEVVDGRGLQRVARIIKALAEGRKPKENENI